MSDPDGRGGEAKRRILRHLALSVASAIVLLGVAAATIPDGVIAIGRYLVSPSGLYVAAAFRIGVGLVLVLTAGQSQTPGLLRAIGAVVLLAGVAVPLFGVEAARARLAWEAAHVAFFRVEGTAFVCLGGFIFSVLRPDRPPLPAR